RDADFEPAHQFLERLFLRVDEENVVEHERLLDIGNVQHQSPRAQQGILEHVGDLLIELEVHGREPLKVAQGAVVVEDLVGQHFPVIQPASDVNDQEHKGHDQEVHEVKPGTRGRVE